VVHSAQLALVVVAQQVQPDREVVVVQAPAVVVQAEVAENANPVSLSKKS
jgi:hypothetical protein